MKKNFFSLVLPMLFCSCAQLHTDGKREVASSAKDGESKLVYKDSNGCIIKSNFSVLLDNDDLVDIIQTKGWLFVPSNIPYNVSGGSVLDIKSTKDRAELGGEEVELRLKKIVSDHPHYQVESKATFLISGKSNRLTNKFYNAVKDALNLLPECRTDENGVF